MFRSVSNMVMAPANTGKDNNITTELNTTQNTKRVRTYYLNPCRRMLNIVAS
jgi:hypothetical protein